MHDDCTNAIRASPHLWCRALPQAQNNEIARPAGQAVVGASTDLRIAYGIWIRLTPNHSPMKKHTIPMTAPAPRAGAEINWSAGRA